MLTIIFPRAPGISSNLNNIPVEAVKEEKIRPITTPASINPEQAKSAPKYFAAANIFKNKPITYFKL